MPLYENLESFMPDGGIPIVPLPRQEDEAGKDWQGRTFGEALELIKRYTAIRFESKIEKENMYLGRLFWLCFLRGGLQGGLWLIDSLEDGQESSEQLQKVVTEWLTRN